MKNFFLLFITTTTIYSQECNSTNWQQHIPNLEYCDLEGVNIAWDNLSEYNFSYANLKNSNLTGTVFLNTNLSNADLSGADLTWATLSGANLYSANLTQAGLGAADFTGANLEEAVLYGAIFFETNFENTCVEGAYWFPTTGYVGEPIYDGCAGTTNSAPIAGSSTQTLDEDTSTTLVLEAYDEDGDALSYMIAEGPYHGSITLLGNVATYVPQINFHGTDNFQFIANDGQFDSNAATVVLIVNAVNDAPYLYSIDNIAIVFGETFSYALQAEDADGDNLLYTVSASGGSAVANINGNILTVEPQEPNVTLNVAVTVTDGNTTHSVAFLITVLQPQQTCLDNNIDGWCDHFPSMSINGDTVLLLGLEPEGEYTDEGATCSDNEEGDISNQVEVSGQVVNMSSPDKYEVYYNCSDSDGNAAQTLTRTVVVIPPFILDENQDGFDDDAFMAGAQSGDSNLDGTLNVIDIVMFIDLILNGD